MSSPTPIAPQMDTDAKRRKCRAVRAHHREKAKKYGVIRLNYGWRDLLKLFEATQTCRYCSMPLGWDAQFDHDEPLARGAVNHRIENIVVCCATCNQMKGCLSGKEFLKLLAFLATIDPRGAWDVKRRLGAGGAVYARGKK